MTRLYINERNFANAIDVADLMWNPQRDLLTNTNSKQRATEQPIQMVINRLLSRFLLASPSSRLYKREHVCPGTCLSSSQLEEKNTFLKIISETFSYKYVFKNIFLYFCTDIMRGLSICLLHHPLASEWVTKLCTAPRLSPLINQQNNLMSILHHNEDFWKA